MAVVCECDVCHEMVNEAELVGDRKSLTCHVCLLDEVTRLREYKEHHEFAVKQLCSLLNKEELRTIGEVVEYVGRLTKIVRECSVEHQIEPNGMSAWWLCRACGCSTEDYGPSPIEIVHADDCPAK